MAVDPFPNTCDSFTRNVARRNRQDRYCVPLRSRPLPSRVSLPPRSHPSAGSSHTCPVPLILPRAHHGELSRPLRRAFSLVPLAPRGGGRCPALRRSPGSSGRSESYPPRPPGDKLLFILHWPTRCHTDHHGSRPIPVHHRDDTSAVMYCLSARRNNHDHKDGDYLWVDRYLPKYPACLHHHLNQLLSRPYLFDDNRFISVYHHQYRN